LSGTPSASIWLCEMAACWGQPGYTGPGLLLPLVDCCNSLRPKWYLEVAAMLAAALGCCEGLVVKAARDGKAKDRPVAISSIRPRNRGLLDVILHLRLERCNISQCANADRACVWRSVHQT
jgi:hypothetical protein